jgi:hypothetical protein
MNRAVRLAASSPRLDADYARLVGDLKKRIGSARTAASRSVNRELILRTGTSAKPSSNAM